MSYLDITLRTPPFPVAVLDFKNWGGGRGEGLAWAN